MIGDHASVVLVGTRAEAIAVLLGELPGLPEKQEPMFGVPPAAPAPVAVASDQVAVDSDLRIASLGRSVGPALAAGARCALLPARRARPHLAFEALHRQVWGNAHLGDRSDVQSVVKRLRRKLRELGCPPEIHAVRGVGIRLVDRRDAPGAAPTLP